MSGRFSFSSRNACLFARQANVIQTTGWLCFNHFQTVCAIVGVFFNALLTCAAPFFFLLFFQSLQVAGGQCAPSERAVRLTTSPVVRQAPVCSADCRRQGNKLLPKPAPILLLFLCIFAGSLLLCAVSQLGLSHTAGIARCCFVADSLFFFLFLLVCVVRHWRNAADGRGP